MKHLKSHKIFESWLVDSFRGSSILMDRFFEIFDIEVIRNIEDICQELKDESWYLSLYSWGENDFSIYLSSNLKNINRKFILSEITEYVYRLIEYAKSEKLNCELEILETFPGKWEDVPLELDENREIHSLKIKFIKPQKPIGLKHIFEMDNIKKYLSKFIGDQKSMDDVKKDIEDICLELSDVGFTCKVYSAFCCFGEYTKSYFTININRLTTNYSAIPFHYYEIEEVVDRMKDYMEDFNYTILAICHDRFSRNAEIRDEKKLGNNEIFGYQIKFTEK